MVLSISHYNKRGITLNLKSFFFRIKVQLVPTMKTKNDKENDKETIKKTRFNDINCIMIGYCT